MHPIFAQKVLKVLVLISLTKFDPNTTFKGAIPVNKYYDAKFATNIMKICTKLH